MIPFSYVPVVPSGVDAPVSNSPLPETCNAWAGFVSPIPKLPSLNLATSPLFSLNLIPSCAFKDNPSGLAPLLDISHTVIEG